MKSGGKTFAGRAAAVKSELRSSAASTIPPSVRAASLFSSIWALFLAAADCRPAVTRPSTHVAVSIPAATGGGQGVPTGIVFSSSNDFAVTNGVATGPSRFIFASLTGSISGWAPNVDLTNAQIAVDRSANGASYTGLALAADGNRNLLYAADVRRGRIDVFDATFAPVTLPEGFHDPDLPSGFVPFAIHNLQGNLYVSFGKRNSARNFVEPGRGQGIVSVFDARGRFLRRIKGGPFLNAPWGMAIAPAGFGRFSNRLLIGNFGDGTIQAFDLANGRRIGALRTPQGTRIVIPVLWGMSFGNGILNQPTNVLFFAAGPNFGTGGLYGRISATRAAAGVSP